MITRQRLARCRSSHWKNAIQSTGVPVIGRLPRYLNANELIVTNCSNTKATIENGTPFELYQGVDQIPFYAFAKKHGLRFGILSDQYGIHFDDEVLPYYDTSPDKQTDIGLGMLGQLVRDKCSERGVDTLYYRCPTPSRSVPYLVMLLASKLKVFYTTKL